LKENPFGKEVRKVKETFGPDEEALLKRTHTIKEERK